MRCFQGWSISWKYLQLNINTMIKCKELLQQAVKHAMLPEWALLSMISDWLEDINWHSENVLFVNTYINEHIQKKIDAVSELHMILNPHQFNVKYVADLIADNEENKAAYLKYNLKDFDFTHFKGVLIHKTDLLDLSRAQKLQYGISYISGWGLDNSFENTCGAKFVLELAELLGLKPIAAPINAD